jgi:hypothetical protein
MFDGFLSVRGNVQMLMARCRQQCWPETHIQEQRDADNDVDGSSGSSGGGGSGGGVKLWLKK